MEKQLSIRALSALITIAAGTALFAAPAQADHPGDAELRVVRPEVGKPLLTHGGDPRPSLRSGRANGRAAFAAGLAPRQPACSVSNYIHVLYARPAGSRSRLKKSKATIRSSMQRTNAMLNAESLASGGTTADYRVRCDTDGQISVDSLITQGSSYPEIVSAARSAGFTYAGADYMVFFDGRAGNICGTSNTYQDDQLTASNKANRGGGYGVAYAGCWTEETPMHEIGHMMGAVQYGAPHSTGTGGHCYEENDVLCYSPDGGDLNQGGVITTCAGAPRFDCGYDDYFDAAPEPGEYLYSHWNVGSPLNSMIAFGGGAPGGGFGATVIGAIQALLEPGKSRGADEGVAAAPGAWQLYDVAVTGGAKTLTVTLDNVTGSGLTMYVRPRKAPTTTDYRCKGTLRKGVATCQVPRPRGGPWVVGVLGDDGTPGTAYRLRAKLKR